MCFSIVLIMKEGYECCCLLFVVVVVVVGCWLLVIGYWLLGCFFTCTTVS